MRISFALLVLTHLVAAPLAAQTWTSAPAMGTARAGAAATVLGGRLYVMGGRDAAGVPLNTVEVYDPATGWSALADLHEPRVDAAAAVLDGRVVVMGGRTEDGEPSNDTEIYDADRDRWESFESLDEDREGLGAAVLDGRLFVFGGAGNGGGLLASTEAYDADDPDWDIYAEWTLSPARARFGVVAEGDALILAGGFSAFGPLDRVDRYLPDQSATQSLPSLPVARGGLALASASGVVYAVGGRDAGDAVSGDVGALMLSGGGWTSLASLPEPREGAVAAVLGGNLFVVGGEDRFGSVLASAVQLAIPVDAEGGPEIGRPTLALVGPNPVRSSTAFEVELVQGGPVRLVIADALGREVAVLLDTRLPAGAHRVAWRAIDLPPGLYLASLNSPNGHAAIPVTRIR